MTPARSLSVEERSRPKRGGSSLFRDGYALIARSGALCRHTTKQRDAAPSGRDGAASSPTFMVRQRALLPWTWRPRDLKTPKNKRSGIRMSHRIPLRFRLEACLAGGGFRFVQAAVS